MTINHVPTRGPHADLIRAIPLGRRGKEVEPPGVINIIIIIIIPLGPSPPHILYVHHSIVSVHGACSAASQQRRRPRAHQRDLHQHPASATRLTITEDL